MGVGDGVFMVYLSMSSRENTGVVMWVQSYF